LLLDRCFVAGVDGDDTYVVMSGGFTYRRDEHREGFVVTPLTGKQ